MWAASTSRSLIRVLKLYSGSFTCAITFIRVEEELIRCLVVRAEEEEELIRGLVVRASVFVSIPAAEVRALCM